jgi:hypothetical protein
MPADDASARSTSSQRGSRAAGAGSAAGAGARFELDFSGCFALAWPGNTGLEEMLLAADVNGGALSVEPERADSPGGSGPEAAVEAGGPEARPGQAAPGREDRATGAFEAPPADADAAGGGGFSELAGRVVEDLLPGPGLAGWLSRAEVGDLPGFELAGVAAACRRLASWAAAAELTAVAEMATRAAARDSSVPVETDGRPASVSPEAAAEVGLALTMSQFGATLWADLAVTLRWRLPGTHAALSEGRIDMSRARLIAELTSVLNDAGARQVEERVLGRAEHQTTGQLRATLRRAVISVDPGAAERRREEAERRARVGLFADEEGTATLSGRNLPGVQACAAMARITALAQAMKAAGAKGGIDLLRAQVLIGLLLNTLPGIPPPLEDPAAPGPPDPGQDGSPGHSADDPPDQEPDYPGQDPDGPQDHGPQDHGPDDPRDGPGGGSPARGDGRRPPGRDSGSSAGRGDGRPTGRDGSGDSGTSRQAGCPPDGRDWRNDNPADAGGARAQPTDDRPPRDHTGPQVPGGPAPPWPPLPTFGGVSTPGCPPGRAGGVRMLVPWRTLAGMSAEPGSVCWLGPITPNAARELAEIAAGDPRTEWRVIVTDSAGRTLLITRVPRQGQPGQGGGGSGLVSRITLTLSRDLVKGTAQPMSMAAQELSGSGGLGRVLEAAVAAARKALVGTPGGPGTRWGSGAQRVPATKGAAGTSAGKMAKGCNHPEAEAHYRPSDRLREFVVARDQTCRFAVCRQPAWAADLDHTIPFDDGGPTCRCNTGPACRTHHQIKQRPGWRLEQPQPGTFVWTTPAGRRYVVAPAQYPV